MAEPRADYTQATILAALLEQNGCGTWQREVRFHPVRKWRFDLARPEVKIGIELNGGTFMQGRHNRSIGSIRDYEKLNAAVVAGWRVLQFSTWHLENSPQLIIETVKGAIGSTPTGGVKEDGGNRG